MMSEEIRAKAHFVAYAYFQGDITEFSLPSDILEDREGTFRQVFFDKMYRIFRHRCGKCLHI